MKQSKRIPLRKSDWLKERKGGDYMQEKKKNIWKWLFLILAGINVGLIVLFFVLVGIPQDVQFPESSITGQSTSDLVVQSDKDSLNKLIDRSVEHYQSNGSFEYDVDLTDYVEFYTDIPIFDNEVPLKMTFDPLPTEDGNLVLEQKSMELGKMDLPISYILNFVNKQTTLPDWIVINPKKEQIHIALDRIETYEDMKLQVNKINLKEDDISFRLLIPD